MLKTISKLFGKPAQKAPAIVPEGSGVMIEKIVVPKSAMDALETDAYQLVQAVVNYVNFLAGSGKFNRFEIPPAALQAYHCDYYLAQVNNGGHAQFIGNAAANLRFTLTDVMDGLLAMQAEKYMKIAEEMARWVLGNPKEIAKQTGFEGGISPELKALDSPFYSLNKVNPLHELNARWIASLPNLQVVEDADMERVLRATVGLNPQLDERLAASGVAELNHMFSDPLRLGLGMAAASAKKTEPLIAITAGSQMDVHGQNATCWNLQTVMGRRFGVVNATGAAIFEYVGNDNTHMPDSLEKITLEDVEAYVAPKVGGRISSVSSKELDMAKAICDHLKAGPAIWLLLSKLQEPPQVTFASVRSAGPDNSGKIGVSITLIVNKATKVFSVVVDETGARLLSEPEHALKAAVSTDEINRFSTTLA